MPKVLWLMKHVCLRVDPLKDAAGSPFGKADRLYLYLLVQKLCVEWVCTNTGNICGVSLANVRSVCLWAFRERPLSDGANWRYQASGKKVVRLKPD